MEDQETMFRRAKIPKNEAAVLTELEELSIY